MQNLSWYKTGFESGRFCSLTHFRYSYLTILYDHHGSSNLGPIVNEIGKKSSIVLTVYGRECFGEQ